MSEYHLLSWGANSHGQLGHGDIQDEELIAPRQVDLSSTDVKPENIAKVVGGAGHTLLLDDAGRVFSCGWNDKGQAGLSKTSSRFQRLGRLEEEKIVDVACGWDSSMALAEDGRLFVWGSNSHGQLGLKQVAVGGKIVKPSRVEFDVPVQRISMGLRHSAVVTRNGEVFVSGAGTKGQLGVVLQGAKYFQEFIKVTKVKNVQDVACGQHHTIVVTKDSEIFAWGDNKHGQLGIDPTLYKVSLEPVKLNNFGEAISIEKLFCGWTHSAVLTADKKVLCWGRNSYGQLGHNKSVHASDNWKADSPATLANIEQFSVGSEHNIALTDDNTILSWGWNEHGNCGNESIENVIIPTKIALPKAKGILIGSGAGHSFAVVKMNF